VTVNFTSISAIFPQRTTLWELGAIEVEIEKASNAVQHTSRDTSKNNLVSEKRYENLADLLDNVLPAALKPKKPSGRYRWRAIPKPR